MKKSVLIFFAVIAAASALRLPVDVKAAFGKLHVIPLKDAGYESDAMADAIPEVAHEEDTPYETVAMKDEYEHEAMHDEVEADSEIAYESNSMADDDSNDDQDYESEEMADPVYESKDMADSPYETVAMKDEYEHEPMADKLDAAPEIAYEKKADGPPRVAPLHVPKPPVVLIDVIGKLHNIFDSEAAIVPQAPQEDEAQAYESGQMADLAYESKHMDDTPYETVAMKDEYEHEAMADELDAVPEIAYEKKADGPPRAAPLHVPQPPVVLIDVIGKLHNIFDSEAAIVPQAPQEDEAQAYESGQMADLAYESKHMDDTPYETVAMKDEYEHEAMADELDAVPEIAYEKKADGLPRVAPLHVPQPPVVLIDVIGKLHNIFDSKAAIVPQAPQEDEAQTYESGQMADLVYESKHMDDTPYETVAMKDEYEVEAMADEVEGAAEAKENETAIADMISVIRKLFAQSRLELRSQFQD